MREPSTFIGGGVEVHSDRLSRVSQAAELHILRRDSKEEVDVRVSLESKGKRASENPVYSILIDRDMLIRFLTGEDSKPKLKEGWVVFRVSLGVCFIDKTGDVPGYYICDALGVSHEGWISRIQKLTGSDLLEAGAEPMNFINHPARVEYYKLKVKYNPGKYLIT